MSNLSELQVGLTGVFPCSYLSEQQEQLIMLIDPEKYAATNYLTLMANGFRRSGDQVYRPHCPSCDACQSLRIHCNSFITSKSQKRLLNKNKHFHVEISEAFKSSYFTLYERYINQTHQGGSMYPACEKQFTEFIRCNWGNSLFIEIYDHNKLIAVSVTDNLNTGTFSAWSAFYCFYDPDYTKHSLGKYAILQQLRLAKLHQIDFLYLGYFIKECAKMNYKEQFKPHQRYINQQWIDFA